MGLLRSYIYLYLFIYLFIFYLFIYLFIYLFFFGGGFQYCIKGMGWYRNLGNWIFKIPGACASRVRQQGQVMFQIWILELKFVTFVPGLILAWAFPPELRGEGEKDVICVLCPEHELAAWQRRSCKLKVLMGGRFLTKWGLSACVTQLYSRLRLSCN